MERKKKSEFCLQMREGSCLGCPHLSELQRRILANKAEDAPRIVETTQRRSCPPGTEIQVYKLRRRPASLRRI